MLHLQWRTMLLQALWTQRAALIPQSSTWLTSLQVRTLLTFVNRETCDAALCELRTYIYAGSLVLST